LTSQLRRILFVKYIDADSIFFEVNIRIPNLINKFDLWWFEWIIQGIFKLNTKPISLIGAA